MKLLIAGSGFIVHDWLTIAKDLKDTELEAIVTTARSEKVGQELATKYGIKHTYIDYDLALAESKADTVYVAVPNFLHYEFTKKALLAGKNVICEKPFTLNLAEFEELKKIALEKNLVLIEAITNIYLPNFKLIKEKLPELGNIRIITMNYSQYSHRYDNFKKGIIEPVFDPEKGGGALLDLNVYNIHLLVELFGLPKYVKYLANIQRGVDTSGILLLDYGDFKVSSIAAKDAGAPITSIIEGDEETIVINGATNSLPSFDIYQKYKKLNHFDVNDHPHRMYDEFVAFEKIIKQHDMDAVKDSLKHSEDVMKVIDSARKEFKQ